MTLPRLCRVPAVQSLRCCPAGFINRTPRMPRRTRQSLRKRAERNVDSYETPTHELNAPCAKYRVVAAWMMGYDAATRDAREAAARRRPRQ